MESPAPTLGESKNDFSMKRNCLLAALSLVAVGGVWAGPTTVDLFENSGNVTLTNPPQVDAVAFANYGFFGVASLLPYDFQNTLYFTNRGSMVGALGFRFDYTDDFGQRRPAHNFVNSGLAGVAGSEGFFIPGYSNVLSPSYLFVSATNITSPGFLNVGNGGNLNLKGKKVNLAGGGLEVLPIESFFFANTIYDLNDDNIPDAFDPDNAVYDIWWGTGVQEPPLRGPINTANLLRFLGGGVQAQSPAHYVTNRNGADFMTSFFTAVPALSFTNMTFGRTGVTAWASITLTNASGTTTNALMPTNIFRQAVVVGLTQNLLATLDTNFQVRARFAPSFTGVAFDTVAIEIASRTTNVVTAQPEFQSIYFVDRLASETNLAYLQNLGTLFYRARPYSMEIYRSTPFEFFSGTAPNTELFRTIVYSPVFSNVFATNFYSGYAAEFDYVQSRPPLVPGATPTNLPGRIELEADYLDLRNTRMRGMGAINLNVNHVQTTAGAKLDVQYLGYNLASTNGLLTVKNLSKESVDRMSGAFRAWSGLWTNQMALVLSNWFIDPNTNYFNPVTVPIDVGIHLLILDASLVVRTQAVEAYVLNLRATNVVVEDPVLVGGSFLIDADGFTLGPAGKLVTTNQVMDWTYTNAPHLRYFTNSGWLSVQNVARYGTGYPSGRHWDAFVNRGTLEAVGHDIMADYYEDTGAIQTVNNLTVHAKDMTLSGGLDQSGGDTQFFADTLKLKNHIINATRAILAITNSLADLGSGANNRISVLDGFHLAIKPRIGDLLGTTLETTAPIFLTTDHTWAAEDRGVSKAGYVDNAAVGRLVLRVQAGGGLRFTKPTDPAGNPLPGSYALYVDFLELAVNLQSDPESFITIEPGFTIYFANANVPVQDLDGKFEGRLRWVRDFAGPSTTTTIASRMGGNLVRTINVNRALADSQSLDSDGDGLANGFDNFPFDGVRLTEARVINPNPFTVRVSWEAAAQTVYRVEYTTNLVSPVWQSAATVTNQAAGGTIMSLTDTVSATALPAGGQRFYRVRYDP
jgi:hypothetical protein